MAEGNPVIATDRFGEEFMFWTDAANVLFSTDLRTSPITAFAQEEEDSPIDVTIDPTGKMTVTFIETDGDRATKSSQRDGDSGTWS